MTLYAIRPNPGDDPLGEDAEVVDQSRYGWQFLEQAVTLWQLVGSSRADDIQGIIDRATLAAGDGELRFYPPDIHELIRLLTGIETAIIEAGIVDQHWRVPAERLEELHKRVPAMDLTTQRSLESKTHALGEIMINAFSLRNFLSDAMKEGCVVVLG